MRHHYVLSIAFWLVGAGLASAAPIFEAMNVRIWSGDITNVIFAGLVVATPPGVAERSQGGQHIATPEAVDHHQQMHRQRQPAIGQRLEYQQQQAEIPDDSVERRYGVQVRGLEVVGDFDQLIEAFETQSTLHAGRKEPANPAQVEKARANPTC